MMRLRQSLKGSDKMPEMTRREILKRYKWLMQEAAAMSKHANRLIKIGAPAGIANQALTGMPRGTNDPQAAGIQAFDGYIIELREKVAEIAEIGRMFEDVLALIRNDQARVICRYYYGVGMTDEQIAKQLKMARQTVTTIRNDTMLSL